MVMMVMMVMMVVVMMMMMRRRRIRSRIVTTTMVVMVMVMVMVMATAIWQRPSEENPGRIPWCSLTLAAASAGVGPNAASTILERYPTPMSLHRAYKEVQREAL